MTQNEQPAGGGTMETSASLLEDASTLLMFHNSAINNNSTSETSPQDNNTTQESQKPQEGEVSAPQPRSQLLPGQLVKRSESPAQVSTSSLSAKSSSSNVPTIPRMNNLTSPGPAIAALADSSDNDGEKDKNSKAIVAAAALAAAAGIPLPLISRNNQNVPGVDETLRSAIRGKTLEESEAILKTVETKVTKEQLQALQEKAALIRQQELHQDQEQQDQQSQQGEQEQEQEHDTEVEKDTEQEDEHDLNNEGLTLKEVDTTERNTASKMVQKESTSTISEKANDNDDDLTEPIQDEDIKQEDGVDYVLRNATDVETQDEKSEPAEPAIPKQRKQRKNKKKKVEDPDAFSVPKDYIVDPDSGLISCVCGYDDDDGFTIQCDTCNRWQHAVCMGIDSIDNAPDDYLCNVCQPRKIDVKRAKIIQRERLNSPKKKRSEKRGKGSEDGESEDSNRRSDTSNHNKNGNNEAGGSGSNIDDGHADHQHHKPKPKPPTNPYGKNLEESDINVLEPKESWKCIYYPLKGYDYQDGDVYRYVEDLKGSHKLFEMTESKFKDLKLSKIIVKPYTDVSSKKFNGITKLGVFVESQIQENDIINEMLGEIGFKNRYITDSRNHYRIWGVEKPYVSFIPNTSLVIDARFSGNLLRFTRRSCHPNCEIRCIKVDDSVKFTLVATKPIKSGSELFLPWNWDPNHPIINIVNGNSFDSTNDADKPSLVLSVESILTFVECGCSQTNDCSLNKVKKASAHIYRSTRKGNNTSGMKLLKKDTPFISIQERLMNREVLNLKDASIQDRYTPIANDVVPFVETEVTIKPYVFKYLAKKRRLHQMEEGDDASLGIEQHGNYIPIPFEVFLEKEKIVTPTNNETSLPKSIKKKLSFADYKKKKKPT